MNMRKRHVPLYLLLAIVAGQVLESSATATDYFPLIKGASWEYRYNDGTSEKNEVVGIKSIDGKPTIHVKSQSGAHWYYIKTNDNVVLYRSSFGVSAYNILKIPPKQGEQYRIAGNVGTIITIVNTNATIKVPAGVFKNCIVKQIYGPDSSETAKKLTGGKVDAHYVVEYYALDIGLIKSENLFCKGSIEIKRETLKELVRYNVP